VPPVDVGVLSTDMPRRRLNLLLPQQFAVHGGRHALGVVTGAVSSDFAQCRDAVKSRLAMTCCSLYVPSPSVRIDSSKRVTMADQIVITEKSSQAKDVRAAVGSRYGDILPAEGHLFDLLEPEDVVPAWKRWSPILLRPAGLYGTRPAEGGNKAAKLRAIREALRTAKRVWLATDCDREGQLIGQEILEHYEYRGQVMRVLFTAQDSQTIRDAFGRAKPNSEYARLYAAAVARRQADQIYNLSLTRTATVILGQGARRVIGVGRVKTPTLAIVCKRELEIRNFVPLAYFEVVATAKVAAGQFQMRHAPQDRIIRREIAQNVVNSVEGFEGPLGVRVEDKRQGPPKLHDLPSLQKLCGSRFGWPASKTLEVAQELYDGQGKKIITYPRAEVRYLPQSLISDVPKIVAGLQVGQSFNAIPVPDPPVIRKGRAALSTTRALSARAITPSFPTSTRSTNCARSGLACHPTRKNCSTSSRGPIWQH
jgi:DNA topoisomerase-3